MLHSTLTLPRSLACEAANVVLNNVEESLREAESIAADRALVTLYGIHDAIHRFEHGCASHTALIESVEDSFPAVDQPGSDSQILLRHALITVLSLLRVSL